MGSTKGIYGMEIRRGKDQREGGNYTEQRGMDKIKFMVLFYLM